MDFNLTPPSERWFVKADCAVFCRSRDRFGGLSNMSFGREIQLGERTWRSSEALYQACRFPDAPEVQEEIFAAASGMEAKKIARAHDGKTRADWYEINVAAMAWTLSHKAETSPRFQGDLAETDTLEIVELSARDAFWGAKPRTANGKELLRGQNVLGSLLGQLRDGARLLTPPAGVRILGYNL